MPRSESILAAAPHQNIPNEPIFSPNPYILNHLPAHKTNPPGLRIAPPRNPRNARRLKWHRPSTALESSNMMLRLPPVLFVAGACALAQPKPTLTPADYGKFETLGAGALSPDGK